MDAAARSGSSSSGIADRTNRRGAHVPVLAVPVLAVPALAVAPPTVPTPAVATSVARASPAATQILRRQPALTFDIVTLPSREMPVSHIDVVARPGTMPGGCSGAVL